MKINDDRDKGYIAVWLTNEEQKHCDRMALTARLLKNIDTPKCKVVYFLSGSEELFINTEGLLLANLKII